MAVSSDLNFQQLSTVQNSGMLLPVTIASATTIAPTTFLSFITSTTQIKTITPPVTGSHLLVLVFTAATPTTTLTTGNISNAIVPATNIPVLLVYDPSTAKYYGGGLKLS